MKGFKDSTKTQYATGGSCYAKGGSVKGAAKVAKVMGEFKRGELHSGSKKGAEVRNPKQAVAIALSEARKAGAKIPVKKTVGGAISTRPTDRTGRRMNNDELNTPERILRQSGQADPYERTPAPLAVKPRSVTVERTTVSEEPMSRSALDRRLSRSVPKSEMDAARAQAGKGSFRSIPLVGRIMGAMGLKKGGLTAMPRSKK